MKGRNVHNMDGVHCVCVHSKGDVYTPRGYLHIARGILVHSKGDVYTALSIVYTRRDHMYKAVGM